MRTRPRQSGIALSYIVEAIYPYQERISRTCSVCSPFVECPARFTGLLASSCHPPTRAERSLSLQFSLPGPPSIAIAISYGSYRSDPLWPALRGQSELSAQPLTLRGSFTFEILLRYYKFSVPNSLAAVI